MGFHDRPYLAWLHELPCAVCHRIPVQAHHVRRLGERKDDRRAVPLCAPHHLHDWGPDAIHRLGRREFERRFGVDLEELIIRLNDQWRNEKAAA